MPTSSFVESGFWCFDALFVPQQHPAREVQDTFYLSGQYTSCLLPHPTLTSSVLDPAVSLPPPKEYYERVSKVHEHGGYGSTGYRAPWSHEESRKLLLRTHTTASSASMLWKLAARCRGENGDGDAEAAVQREGAHASPTVPGAGKAGPDGFRPAKLFSIDRVFRNETMDATHLAEFHQVEGVVADRGLTLADLIGRSLPHLRSRVCLDFSVAGFMRVFFKKMGIENIRFKPAYNPYTEASPTSRHHAFQLF